MGNFKEETKVQTINKLDMKKLFFLMFLLAYASITFGQVWCGGIAIPDDWDFDGGQTPYNYILEIDSLSNPNNIWQIGTPQKGIINNAYSNPNVIITDTIDYYPPNDTSVFIFKHIDQGGYSSPHSAELAGYYYVNSDSLNDYGTIEISLDQGTSWINLITDTIYSSYYYWLTPKPTLTGNSNGWQNFWVSLEGLGYVFNVNYGDTILLKFSFITDSIVDTLDGLAYDNFQFCDGVERIKENSKENLISIYPNPTNGLLYIERENNSLNATIQIYNSTGSLLYEEHSFNGKLIDTKKINLIDGIYLLKYSDSECYTIKQFLIQK